MSAVRGPAGERVRAGLLHTVPALAGSFHASITAAAPGIELVHLADPWLLQTAIDVAVTPEVTARVREHVDYLIAEGAQAVLVTCSSIGNAVDEAAEAAAVPVLRVDAPMAADAVAAAAAAGKAADRPGRIAVLATLQATLGPTGQLIQRSVDAAQADVAVTATVVAGAIAARDAGDQAGHDRLIAEAVQAAASGSDVVVLAQASMAQAVSGQSFAVPVMTSPERGVAALLAALGVAADASGDPPAAR